MADDSGPTVVIVVSDDPLVREEARYGFPAGVEVQIVDDARDAWKAMVERRPDVVVVEMQTGSAGGFNLARDMQAVGKLADVPILILLEREQDSWLARQARAARYRVKPLTAASLVQETLALASA